MRICPACGARFTGPVAFCVHDGTPTVEAADPAPQDPLLGSVIDGRYRVEASLGEGGMGAVYLVSHVALGKRMALKVLRGEMAKDPDVVQRFVQEAQTAGAIGHPNIVDVSDFGVLPDGSAYFVMEYLDGISLSRFIARGGSVPMATAIHVVRQIASALEAAHARGIVHRDLKPDNVYLVRRGPDEHFVKVLDFGIAKVGGANAKLTHTGMIFGTPHYMSPEQAAGQSVDRRADIYALGVIMYEMFTGKVPFEGDTFMGILAKHMFEPPLSPSQVHGKGLGPIEDVILRALAKKPEDRYPSMGVLIADLDRASLGGTVETARRGGIASPADLPDVLEPPSRTEVGLGRVGAEGVSEAPSVLPRRRVPVVVLALVAMLVVGLAGGGAVLWASESSSLPGPPATAPGPAVAPAPSSSARATRPMLPLAPPEPAVAIVPEPPVPRTVAIVSEPPGAEVVVDDVIVGNTPVSLPVPTQGERVAHVRLRGYEEASVSLAASSPDSVRVTLERARISNRSPRAPVHAATPPAADPERPRPPPPPRPVQTYEVLDPWAL